MTVLFAVSCRSSRTAVKASVSRQASERTADTVSASAGAALSARVTVGAVVADTRELLVTPGMADSLTQGASLVSASGVSTLTVTKTAKGLAVKSRTPRAADVSAELSSESRHEASAMLASERDESAHTGMSAASSAPSNPKGWLWWLPIVLSALLLVYLGWLVLRLKMKD